MVNSHKRPQIINTLARSSAEWECRIRRRKRNQPPLKWGIPLCFKAFQRPFRAWMSPHCIKMKTTESLGHRDRTQQPLEMKFPQILKIKDRIHWMNLLCVSCLSSPFSSPSQSSRSLLQLSAREKNSAKIVKAFGLRRSCPSIQSSPCSPSISR